jgi:hypothetical protein
MADRTDIYYKIAAMTDSGDRQLGLAAGIGIWDCTWDRQLGQAANTGSWDWHLGLKAGTASWQSELTNGSWD